MAVDNPRFRARHELEELGMSAESASYLVDDRPPRGAVFVAFGLFATLARI